MVRHSFLIRKIEGSNPSIPENINYLKKCDLNISYRAIPVG